MAIDIDHFKNINDQYGHDAGDLALKHLARLMRENSRISDITARVGGEEFIIILDYTDLKGAKIFAEKLRLQIESSAMSLASTSLNLTISLGIAEVNSSTDMDSLLKEADLALYTAKSQGRNQVVIFKPVPTE